MAMVGQSGSGKSTIAQLLERYYDVDDGEISISGTNIRDIDINKYRRTLSYVLVNSIPRNLTKIPSLTHH